MPHVDQIDYDTAMLDVRRPLGTISWARGVRHVFTVGFCMGGRLAFLTAAREELGLSGAIGFYGSVDRPGARRHARAARSGTRRASSALRCWACSAAPTRAFPQDTIAAFGEALTAAGVDNELVTYPGAPHSFFDRKAAEFADASADAWVKLLEFIDRQTAGTAAV